MKPKQPSGPPMTLGNMRESRRCTVDRVVPECACRRKALIEVSSYPAEIEVP